MLKDSNSPRYAVRRTRRTYSVDTKAQLVAACLIPGASIGSAICGLVANPMSCVRISAIVDACFRLIEDGVSAPSWTRRGW